MAGIRERIPDHTGEVEWGRLVKGRRGRFALGLAGGHLVAPITDDHPRADFGSCIFCADEREGLAKRRATSWIGY